MIKKELFIQRRFTIDYEIAKATKGSAVFMLKQSAVLKKKKKGCKRTYLRLWSSEGKGNREISSNLESRDRQYLPSSNEAQMLEEDKYNQ